MFKDLELKDYASPATDELVNYKTAKTEARVFGGELNARCKIEFEHVVGVEKRIKNVKEEY